MKKLVFENGQAVIATDDLGISELRGDLMVHDDSAEIYVTLTGRECVAVLIDDLDIAAIPCVVRGVTVGERHKFIRTIIVEIVGTGKCFGERLISRGRIDSGESFLFVEEKQ